MRWVTEWLSSMAFLGTSGHQGPVLLLRHDAVARILANGSEADAVAILSANGSEADAVAILSANGSEAPIGWKDCDSIRLL